MSRTHKLNIWYPYDRSYIKSVYVSLYCYNNIIEDLNADPKLIHSYDKLGASEFVCCCEQFDAGERTFGRKSLLLNVKMKSVKYLGNLLNTYLMGCRLFSFLWNFMGVPTE